MDIQAIKLDVVRKILSISEELLLNKIHDILESEMVVSYTTNGKPLTKEMYNRRLEISEQQIVSGEVISQEDLELESENW